MSHLEPKFRPLPFLTHADWDLSDSVWGFTKRYLWSRFDAPKATPFVHREWWAMCMSEHPQVAIAAPRHHAKSSAITFACTLFELLERRSQHMMILGANEELSALFIHDMRAELTENDLLIADYGVHSFVKETETELIVKFTDGEKFRVIGKGAGQRMRGIKWERKRPDRVYFDDLEDEESVATEQRRDKMTRWFYGTVRPIIRSGGKIRGVGTIIAFDSLLDRMMPSNKHKETIKEPLRIYALKPQTGWASVRYRGHDELFEHVLWEQQISAEQYKRLRSEYAARGILDVYGQEYLNEPLDSSRAYFRQQDFLPMRPQDFETQKTFYAAGDLAIGETDRNAFTVLIVGGIDTDGILHIVDVRRDRIDGLQICNELFSIQERWSPEIFRLESEAIEKSIGSFVNREMTERNVYINIDSAPPTKDKDKRAQSIRARMRAGKVRFNKEAEWYAAFEEELLKYPKSQFMDQVDAVAWLGLLLDEMIEPASPQEQAEEEFWDQMQEHLYDGRCEATGY